MPNLTITTERLNGNHKFLIANVDKNGGAYILISDRQYEDCAGFNLTADERWELIEFLSRES